jgi:hypothetical protein
VAWFVGVALSFAGMEALVTTNSRWWFGGLGLAALAAFILASWFSEEAEEAHPPGRLMNVLHWFTVSVISLVVVMILGVVASSSSGWPGSASFLVSSRGGRCSPTSFSERPPERSLHS